MRPWIMFTKHLEGWDLTQIMDGLQRAGVEGALEEIGRAHV